MTDAGQDEVTRILEAIGRGDRSAVDSLFTLLYDDLRGLAHRQRRRLRGNSTLNTTALVHEAYLKLVDQTKSSWENRVHFSATAALAMRHVLVDYARRRQRQKRGGDRIRVSLDALTDGEGRIAARDEADPGLLVAFDEALAELERVNERQGRVVVCRIFGGLTIEETAAALGVSTATVSRAWSVARARLVRMLGDSA